MAKQPAAPEAAQPPPAAPASSLQVVYLPLRDLRPYARNARKHPKGQLAQIKASLLEFGWTNPMLIADGEMIAGHGRLMAALELANEGKAVPRNPTPDVGPTIDLSHLSPDQRRAYVLADNKIAENAEWDDDLVAAELRGLQEAGFGAAVTGFSPAEIKRLLDRDGDGTEPARGALLEREQITIAEPRNTVVHGDRYRLGGRHTLIAASVIEDWPEWAALLAPGTLFCPYPGPFLPFGTKAADRPLLMVQPDLYIAGHILDRYEDAFGPEAIEKLSHARVE